MAGAKTLFWGPRRLERGGKPPVASDSPGYLAPVVEHGNEGTYLAPREYTGGNVEFGCCAASVVLPASPRCIHRGLNEAC